VDGGTSCAPRNVWDVHQFGVGWAPVARWEAMVPTEGPTTILALEGKELSLSAEIAGSQLSSQPPMPGLVENGHVIASYSDDDDFRSHQPGRNEAGDRRATSSW
jgi:hypothetical protein